MQNSNERLEVLKDRVSLLIHPFGYVVANMGGFEDWSGEDGDTYIVNLLNPNGEIAKYGVFIYTTFVPNGVVHRTKDVEQIDEHFIGIYEKTMGDRETHVTFFRLESDHILQKLATQQTGYRYVSCETFEEKES